MKHFSLKQTRVVSNEKGVMTQFRLLWAALNKFDDDHGFFLSAGITFNFLICLIPLALLLLALLGTYLYSDREVLDQVRQYLENVIPSLDPTIMKSMLTIMLDRKIVGIFGIAGLIWTSTWVFSSLRTALNIVFQVEKGRSLVRGKAVDLFMIFLAGFFLLMSMTLTSAITIIQGYSFRSFINIGPIIHWVLKYLLPFFFTYWMFFLVYKIVPNKKVSFKAAAQAACFTSILWEVAKQLFGWYVLHIGRFSIVYGSLSAVAIFFLWIYYSSAMLILGGDVACLLDKGEQRINLGPGERRRFMQIFLWLSFLMVLCVGIFVVQNSTAPPAVMRFLFWNYETSLVYTILVSVGSGMLIVLLLWIPRAIKASSRVRDLKKEIEFMGREKKHQIEANKPREP